MTRLIFVITAGLLLAGCNSQPISRENTDNKEVQVDRLFSIDGCQVYRFSDGGRSHYIAKCVDQTTVTDNYCYMAGKVMVCSEDSTASLQVRP